MVLEAIAALGQERTVRTPCYCAPPPPAMTDAAVGRRRRELQGLVIVAVVGLAGHGLALFRRRMAAHFPVIDDAGGEGLVARKAVGSGEGALYSFGLGLVVDAGVPVFVRRFRPPVPAV